MSSDSMILDQPSGKLDEVAELVCSTNSPVTVKTLTAMKSKSYRFPSRFGSGRVAPFTATKTQSIFIWIIRGCLNDSRNFKSARAE